jgi:hypothetical protein
MVGRRKSRPPDKCAAIHDLQSLIFPLRTIAHLTRECGGNVHDGHAVEVACRSFEKEAEGANPHFGGYDDKPQWAANKAAELETGSYSLSTYREKREDIPHTTNNWVSCGSRERRIAPTPYAIRTNEYGPGGPHLKSWLVETSVDGENWREVAREEDNEQLNGSWFTGTFPVARGGECRFIRLASIGRNYFGNDQLNISV